MEGIEPTLMLRNLYTRDKRHLRHRIGHGIV